MPASRSCGSPTRSRRSAALGARGARRAAPTPPSSASPARRARPATKDLTAAALAPHVRGAREPGVVQQRDRASRSRCSARRPDAEAVVARDGRPRPRATSPRCATIARPTVGVITNIGLAHAEHLGGPRGRRPGEGRAARGARRPTGSRCSTPTTTATPGLARPHRRRASCCGSAAPAGADVRGRRRRSSTTSCAPRSELESPWGSGRVAARGARRAPGRRTPRWRRPSRWRVGVPARRRRRRPRRAVRPAPWRMELGAHRRRRASCSTTPTTRARRRWPRRSRRSRALDGARTPDRGARRDARARRARASRARRASASSSAPSSAIDAAGRGRRAEAAPLARRGTRRGRRRSPRCRDAAAALDAVVGVVGPGRRGAGEGAAGRSGSSWSPTCAALGPATGGGARDRAPRRRWAPRSSLCVLGTPAPHPGAAGPRHRPADPRRRPVRAPARARRRARRRWAASRSSSARSSATSSRTCAPSRSSSRAPGITLMVAHRRAWRSSASSTTTSACASGRNLGLRKRGKTGGQLIVGRRLRAARAPLGRRVDAPVVHPRRSTSTSAAGVWFVVGGRSSSSASSNAVNLTDGLDGLAAGSAALVFAAFVIIAFWQFRHPERLRRAARRRARPRGRGGRDDRRLRRVPVVERGARRRSSWATPARSRSAAAMAGLALLTNTHPAAADPRRPLRARDAERDRPGRSRSAASSGGCCAWRRSTTTSRWAAGRSSP